MTAIAELARLLEESDFELPSLSDDEIAALSPLLPAEARLVPLVTHAGLGDEQRTARIGAGEQSLLARGLLLEAVDGVATSDELRAILAIRESPLAVTIVDVVREESIDSCYAYGLGDASFLLTETVNGGVHAFAVRSAESTAEQLAAAIDPDDRCARSEGLVLAQTADAASPGWSAVERAAEQAEATASLYAVHRTSAGEVIELNSSIAVTEDGVWLVAGEVDTDTGAGRIDARQLSRSDLVVALRSFLGQSQKERERGDPPDTLRST
jgi:hypothetical protein